jgi:hypothetical protein
MRRTWVTWGRVPLLRAGLLGSLLLFGVMLAGGAGGLPGMALTSAGLALAWGFLLAGATAGGWGARLAVLAVLGVGLVPAWAALSRGYAGIVLLAGLVAYVGWRWWSRGGQPLLDLAVTGALALVLFATVAERTPLLGAQEIGGLYGLFLTLESAILVFAATPVLMTVGASMGDLAGTVTGGVSAWLMRLGVPVLMGLVAAGALAKVGWNVWHHQGGGWLTGLLLAAAWGGWLWLTRPRQEEWPRRLPGVELALAVVYTLLAQFGNRGLLAGMGPSELFLGGLYLTGAAALLLGLGALLTGRRPVALVSGLVGIWLLLGTGNGSVRVPVPVLDWLSRLPSLELAVTDTVVTVALAGWAGRLWLQGRRDPAPFALVLGALLVLTSFAGTDRLFWHAQWAVIPFAVAVLYTLSVAVTEAARRTGQAAVVWAGLAMGGAALTFAAGTWAAQTDMQAAYSPAGSPALGYGVFTMCLFLQEVLRRMHALTAEGREAA